MINEKNIKARFSQKHDIEENWQKATGFIPKAGEIIVYDVDANHVRPRVKIGDGTTFVNDLPFTGVGLSTGENSEIFNDYENNKALGKYSSAKGLSTVAGAKGYYVQNLDTLNRRIYLSTTECVPTFYEEFNPGEDYVGFTIGYEVGDIIDITAYSHYQWIQCATISEVG